MRLPNLDTASMRHLIKIRTFVKKRRVLLVRRFKSLALGRIF